ncbi:FliH/SctL family protein [Thermosulfurimonas sp. F29]|uniref:FliH/SctL family protein n=1 Tax=Thermosulfurimonas sp. F29 TaxID=2867247 RepID=UPI001C82DFC4|nr:FliH/SctL family protein [Thermosulfurimonas sp. F29]MBX6423055.1 hypothetical protein [Thermosulfurimonas sp. F29]
MSKILKSSMIRMRRLRLMEAAPIQEGNTLEPSSEKEFSREVALAREKAYREGYREGFEEGRTEGFEKGYREGRHRADKELSQKKAQLETELGNKIKELDELLESLKREISGGIFSLDREVLSLLKVMARKFLFKEALKDETLILRVIREALKEVVEGARIKIRVHPREAEFLKRFDLSALSQKSLPALEIVADPSITPGGCLIETNFGLVDATLERRWEELLKTLKEVSDGEG